MQERLIFVISPPRAGSTLLVRVLHALPEVLGGPEPHLIPPLAHLGWWRAVDAAPYDPLRAAEGLRGLVARLPRTDADFLDACRAATDHIYRALLTAERPGARFIVDKTPTNALCLPFLTRLYPAARYIALTRHPAAIASSHAHSFFAGDHDAARRHNPVLERWIPPMARLLRHRTEHLLHVVYEDLVTRPEEELARICDFLGLPHRPEALDYGAVPMPPGPGDPIGVDRYARPVADRALAWVDDLRRPAAFRAVEHQLAAISDADLQTWGTPRPTLWEPLIRAGVAPATRPRLSAWYLQRRLLAALRHDLDRRPHAPLVHAMHRLSTVLLRGNG